MHKIEYDRCIYEIKSKVYFLTEHSIGYYWSIDLKTNAFWNTHRSVCNAISMRWIWLNAIPRSLSLISFYIFTFFRNLYDHTHSTPSNFHILFYFTSPACAPIRCIWIYLKNSVWISWCRLLFHVHFFGLVDCFTVFVMFSVCVFFSLFCRIQSQSA